MKPYGGEFVRYCPICGHTHPRCCESPKSEHKGHGNPQHNAAKGVRKEIKVRDRQNAKKSIRKEVCDE